MAHLRNQAKDSQAAAKGSQSLRQRQGGGGGQAGGSAGRLGAHVCAQRGDPTEGGPSGVTERLALEGWRRA